MAKNQTISLFSNSAQTTFYAQKVPRQKIIFEIFSPPGENLALVSAHFQTLPKTLHAAPRWKALDLHNKNQPSNTHLVISQKCQCL